MSTNTWPRAIIHVDMDAFFAAVEELDNPSLRGKAVIVGGSPEERGVVCSASYPARKFGVRSAMPMSQALRLCPQGIMIHPHGDRYAEISQEIHSIFAEFTPLVESVSVDEAFLDITGSQLAFGPPPAIGFLLKERIRKATQLTASVGIAPCKFVAKIASDMEKPDGLVIIPKDEIAARLAPLPVRRLWGVGPGMEEALLKIGIRTIAQLRSWPREDLGKRFGSGGAELQDLAWGIDPSPVVCGHEAKSISRELTFAKDVQSVEELSRTIMELADDVASQMRAAKVKGKVAFLKLRYEDFSTITRRSTLKGPCDTAAELAEEARRLLLQKTEAGLRPVRLIGVGLAGLTDSNQGEQGRLFGENGRRKQSALERAADAVRAKHGSSSIRRATNIEPPEGKE